MTHLFSIITGFFIIFNNLLFSQTIIHDNKTSKDSLVGESSAKIAMDYYLNGLAAEQDMDYENAIKYFKEALKYDKQPIIYNQLTNLFININDFNKALENINLALQIEPNNLDNLYLKADVLYTLKQTDSIIVTLNRILVIDSTQSMAMFKLADMYYYSKPEEAIRIYLEILKHYPDDWNILSSLFNLFFDRNDFENSVLYLKKLIQINKNDKSLRLLLTELLLKNNKIDETLAELEQLSEEFPDDLEIKEKLGTLYLNNGMIENSVEQFNHLLEGVIFNKDKVLISMFLLDYADKYPTLIPTIKNSLEEVVKDSANYFAYFCLGDLYSRLNEADSAIYFYTKSLELTDEYHEPYIRLGFLFFEKQDAESVIEKIGPSLKKFPEERFINYLVGSAYLEKKEYLLAETPLLKAYAADTRNIYFVSGLAYLYLRMKDYKNAIHYCTIGLEQYPNNLDFLVTLGLTFDAMENWSKCDSLYTTGLEVYPESELLLNNYAYSLSKRSERLKEALSMVEKALEKDSLNSSFLDTKGWVLYKMGDFESAKTYIKKSIENGGESPVVLDHLGDVYSSLGELEKAKISWEKSLYLIESNNENDSSLAESIKRKLIKGEN